MKKLKVTWQDGSWNTAGEQPIATAEVSVNVTVTPVGETLVFRQGGTNGPICLVVSEQRLISAVEIEVAE